MNTSGEGVNTREGEGLFKVMDRVGTRTNGDNLLVNTFRLKIRRRFLIELGKKNW